MKILFENWRRYRTQTLKELEGAAPSVPAGAEKLAQAYAGGPDAVRAFLNSPEGRDPKVRQILGHPEPAVDGQPADDKITVEPGNVQVKNMIPTQKFIDLMQSVSFPLGSAEVLQKNISAKKGHGPITTSGKFIVDGHHRWSGIFAIAPDGTISVTNLGFPGNANQKLASAQLAIGSIDPNTNDPHPSKGGEAAANILGKSAGVILKLIMNNIGKQTDPKAPGPLLNDAMIQKIIATPMTDVLEWAGVPEKLRKDPNKVRKYIAIRVAKNLATLPNFAPGAPDREDMPQFDHPSIGGDKAKKKIYGKLAADQLNIVPPFIKAGAKAAAPAEKV